MRKVIIVICVAALFAVGFFVGLRFGDAPAAVVETASSAVRQADGSLILERKPDASATAKMIVPKNSKVERIAKVVVKPRPLASAASSVDCSPVTVDLALVKMPDETKRLIARSPDGVVIGGFDTPMLTAISSAATKWSAGISYDDQKHLGVWVHRDFDRAVVGVAARQSDVGLRGELQLGWRF